MFIMFKSVFTVPGCRDTHAILECPRPSSKDRFLLAMFKAALDIQLYQPPRAEDRKINQHKCELWVVERNRPDAALDNSSKFHLWPLTAYCYNCILVGVNYLCPAQKSNMLFKLIYFGKLTWMGIEIIEENGYEFVCITMQKIIMFVLVLSYLWALDDFECS